MNDDIDAVLFDVQPYELTPEQEVAALDFLAEHFVPHPPGPPPTPSEIADYEATLFEGEP